MSRSLSFSELSANRKGVTVMIWLAPRIVGVVFLVAALSKVIRPAGLVTVLRFDGIPDPLIGPIVWAVVLSEALVGQMLLLGLAQRVLLQSSIVILILFSAQLTYLVLATDAPSCGCISLRKWHSNARASNIRGLFRNGLLLAIAIWALWTQSRAQRAPLARVVRSGS